VGLVERQFVRTLKKRGQLVEGEEYSAHKQGQIVSVAIGDEPFSAAQADELGLTSLQPGKCALTYSAGRLALIFGTGAYVVYSWSQIGPLVIEDDTTLQVDIPAAPHWITMRWQPWPKEKDVAAFLAEMVQARETATG
jgi:hypothetical protein